MTRLNSLATCLFRKGDLAGAEPLYRHALQARERVLGPAHPHTLTSVNGLALVLDGKGQYAGAEPLYRRALKAGECVLGPEHPEVLAIANNLAGLLESKGDYTDAEPLYRRALEGLLKTSAATGGPHPHMQTFLDNYVACLEKQKRSPKHIRTTLEAMLRPFGMVLGGGCAENEELTPKLRAVIEQITREPSRFREIADQLRSEDPNLFMEVLQWIQSQQ